MENNKSATGTHLITVILKDYSETDTITFECEEKINADDVSTLMHQAADLAEKDGFVGWMQNIPEKYFSEVCLKVVPHIITEIDNMKIGQTEQEKAGVYVATCRDCNSFEDGSCYKYGGLCDPNACDSDCVHGENIFRVEHKKNKTVEFVTVDNDLEYDEIAKILGYDPKDVEIAQTGSLHI